MKYLYKIYTMICICCLATSTITAQLNPVPFQSFEWAKSMGGLSSDSGISVAIDALGNVYTTGFFEETVDFDPDVVGVHELESKGGYDIFISKLDSLGNFVWAKNMGGPEADAGHSITIDNSGNVYTTGYFRGRADFDPDDVAEYNLDSDGDEDIFVSKLDVLGNFIWAKRMGGTLGDQANSIALDVFENVYTTGYFQGIADFDPDLGVVNNLNSEGQKDIFISKLDALGNYMGAESMGGELSDIGQSITLDASGNIHTTGSFEGMADFDPKGGTRIRSSNGETDIFISKLDTNANFLAAKKIGGLSRDGGGAITVDVSGNIYFTGSFDGIVDFDPKAGIFNLSSTGPYAGLGAIDIFVCKLDASGNFIWAKNMGGDGLDTANSIALDSGGNVYTTGYFSESADFDPDNMATFDLPSLGGNDIFISKLDVSGNFKWAKSMGGDGNDYGQGVAVSPSFNVYTTGSFEEEVDFDPGTGIDNHLSEGFSDAFVHKITNTLLGTVGHIVPRPIIAFPNPTARNVHLDLGQFYDEVTLSIKNVDGEFVSAKDYEYTDNIVVDINGSPGMYFVEVWLDGKKSTTLKVLKQ